MVIIDNEYPFLVDAGEAYRIDEIVSSTDVGISLDKKLVVAGNVNICGVLHAATDVAIQGNMVVKGDVGCEGNIAAKRIVCGSTVNIEGTLYSQMDIRMGPAKIKGTITAEKNIQSLGVLQLEGEIAAKNTIELRGESTINGSIVAGVGLIPRNSLKGDFKYKVMGRTISSHIVITGVVTTMVFYRFEDNSIAVLLVGKQGLVKSFMGSDNFFKEMQEANYKFKDEYIKIAKAVIGHLV
jgi:cytoskeletal protein CcmA (bactofilin family)